MAPIPLFLAFVQRLYQAGLPVGVGDAEALLRALQAGFGVADKEAFRRLCRTLWCRTVVDEARLEPVLTWLWAQAPAPEAEKPTLPTRHQPAGRPDRQPLPAPTGAPPEHGMPRFRSIGDLDNPDLAGQGVAHYEARRAARADLAEFNALSVPVQPGDPLPMARRSAIQSWRRLRCLANEGVSRELDLQATVASISRNGGLWQVVAKPNRVNRAQLVLLLDWDGSMVPFRDLAGLLADAAAHAFREAGLRVLYFHNVPGRYLYHDPGCQRWLTVGELLAQLSQPWSHLVIVSDGGAARGGYSSQRLAETRRFLALAGKTGCRLLWLNPLPRDRWRATTAGELAHHVPMWPCATRFELERGLGLLRRPPVLPQRAVAVSGGDDGR